MEILLSLTVMVAMLSVTIEHSLTLSPTPPPVTALIITFVHSLSYSLHYSGLYVFVFLLVGEYTLSFLVFLIQYCWLLCSRFHRSRIHFEMKTGKW